MIRRLAALLSIVLTAFFAAMPAYAGLSKAQLDDVFIRLPTGAALPLGLPFRDEYGRGTTLRTTLGDKPAVVIFSDYTCNNICGPVLAFAAGGLDKTGLTPGRDFRLVAIGLDPKDTLAQARSMKRTRVGHDTMLAAATTMLTGASATIRAVTQAVGYHYTYDKATDQFAHPAVALVVAADGRVGRVLSGLGLDGQDLRLALVEAGHGRVGTIADQIRVLCYGYDPATGIYSAAIGRIMTAAALATVIAIAFFIALLTFWNRRRARA